MEDFKFYFSRRKLISLALVALVTGSALGGVLWSIGGNFTLRNLTKFSSEQELADFLKTNPGKTPQSLFERIVTWFQTFTQGDMRIFSGDFQTFQNSILSKEGGTISDYSTTNIQVEGVDEPDIVKTDGQYLYLASGSHVYIAQAYPAEDAKLLSNIDLNMTVVGMFVNGEKLVILQNSYNSEIYRTFLYYYPPGTTSIIVYDISNRSKPTLDRNLTVDGGYVSSRMIGDYVYVVVNKMAQVLNNGSVALPVINVDNSLMKVEAENVYRTELMDYSYYFTSVIAVNVRDAEDKPNIVSFLLGAASTIFVSTENIYLTSYVYSTPYGTNIHKINVNDGNISPAVSGSVAGYVLNQYSMDEYNGFFRIATSDGKSTSVTIFDANLKTIGKIEGLAPGEYLHSARFMGERCYLVTFKKTDPLFVINLKDPTNPQVLGQLKIPGYSDYLHLYDETHLIGVGKETVEAENGDFVWYQGIKISLFDVSNVSQPKEIRKIEIGDRGTDSLVLKDPKAFLFSKSKNLLVLPILLAEIDEGKYPLGIPPSTQGDFVWQGAYIFNITLEEGLKYRGGITHIENITELIKTGYYYSSPYSVKRALYIDNVLYTISDRIVIMNSLDDLKEIGSIKLS
jgi:uncharacterized secreted protein with C-terminal beta-propeller domain